MDYLHKASGTYALCGGKLENTKVWWTRESAIRLRGIVIVVKNMSQRLGKEAAPGLRQGPEQPGLAVSRGDKTEDGKSLFRCMRVAYPPVFVKWKEGGIDRGIPTYQAWENYNNDGTQAWEICVLHI